jgi:hypothetical protein
MRSRPNRTPARRSLRRGARVQRHRRRSRPRAAWPPEAGARAGRSPCPWRHRPACAARSWLFEDSTFKGPVTAAP